MIVRPNEDLTRSENRIMAGVPIAAKVLQGTVVAMGPEVVDLALNDEVLFRRPEGELPELAFMDADVILGRLEIPDYG